MTAAEERARIVAHIREGATRLLVEAMMQDQYSLEKAEVAATVMEEIASVIEEGDHWRAFV